MGISDIRKAEELFAFVCEVIEPGARVDRIVVAQSFQDVCMDRLRPMTMRDLRDITSTVTEGLHDQTRSQQVFPVSGFDQYRYPLIASFTVTDLELSLEEQLREQERGEYDVSEPSL